MLEEPGAGAPRNFLLLAPSQFDLLPTLRSRSLAVYLGPAAPLADAEVAPLAEALAAAVGAWAEGGAVGPPARRRRGAARRGGRGGRELERSARLRPWSLAAAAVVRAARGDAGRRCRGACAGRSLELAAALLEAPPWRLRGVPAERLVEGLVFRHLAAPAAGGVE